MWSYIIGYFLDLALGDPQHWYHPVRAIGQLIQWEEKILYKKNDSKLNKRIKGFVLLVTVVSLGFVVPFLFLILMFRINVFLGIGLEAWLIYRALATRQLDKETKIVYRALKKGDLEEGKKYIAYLVSRETKDMTEEDVIKAAIETMAENIGDGVIAPMFYAVIGGAPLSWAYKSANTLDSMVGYKNEKYEDFGYASAKFDDLLNYIPARLSSIFIIIAGFFLKLNVSKGLKVLKRDRHNHTSPNSAYPESAAAGLLDIQLGGKATYDGQTTYKLTMGDKTKAIQVADLKKTSRLLYVTSFIGWLILGLCVYGWRVL